MRISRPIFWLIGFPFVFGCSSDPETELVIVPQDAGVEAMPEGSSEVGMEDVVDGFFKDVRDAQPDASMPSVIVGLHPTPAEAENGVVLEEAQMEAILLALAAGARAVVLDVAWEQVDKDDAWWSQVEMTASYLDGEGKDLLLSICVVDALKDTRPASLQGQAWSSLSTRQAMLHLIDRIFSSFGPELAYVSFGMDVDQFLGAHGAQKSAFVSGMTEMLEQARNHPKKQERTLVGLTWSTLAWADDAEGGEDRDDLVAASDVVMLAHYGLGTADQVQGPTEALGQIGKAIDVVSDRPVVLHRVAYSTSGLLKSREADQADFVSGLFSIVAERRDRVPFVGVVALHDPPPESCLSFAQARDVTGSAELYAFWCSTGLRGRDGGAKQAFSAFLQGATALLVP